MDHGGLRPSPNPQGQGVHLGLRDTVRPEHSDLSRHNCHDHSHEETPSSLNSFTNMFKLKKLLMWLQKDMYQLDSSLVEEEEEEHAH